MDQRRRADGHRPARRPRHPGPLRGRAALRPPRRAQAQLPRGRRGARRHRRGRPPPGEAGRHRRARAAPAIASTPPDVTAVLRVGPCGPIRHRPTLRPPANGFAPHAGGPATWSTVETTWSPTSWRDRPAAQQPDWPDDGALDARRQDARRAYPPLVFAGEAREPHRRARPRSPTGEAFLLQAGDCAESFDAFSADAIRDKLKVILQMAVVLHLLLRRAGGEGRPHRRPVRQAPLGRHRDHRRRRAAVVPRPHRQRHRLHRGGPGRPTPSACSPPTTSRRRR